MLQKKWYFSLSILVILIVLCSCATQTLVDFSPVAFSPQKEASLVLVLPLSVYETSLPQNFSSWQRINLSFYEALKTGFLSLGYLTIPYEEVLATLLGERPSPPSTSKIKISSSLLELYQEEDWSPLMKEEIALLIHKEIKQQHRELPSSKSFFQLHFSREKIFDLAQSFGARYAIQGRIIEFKIREKKTLNPFKIGLLTASNRLVSRFLYGVPKSKDFGIAQEISVGGILSGIIGSNAKDPFEPPHKKTLHVGHPLFGKTITKHSGGTDDYDILNALSWGAAGILISYLAAHGGHTPEAVLMLSLDVYDVQQKQLVWANRIRLRVSPQSMWAPKHPEDLLLSAIEEAAQALVTRLRLDLKKRSSSPHLVLQQNLNFVAFKRET